MFKEAPRGYGLHNLASQWRGSAVFSWTVCHYIPVCAHSTLANVCFSRLSHPHNVSQHQHVSYLILPTSFSPRTLRSVSQFHFHANFAGVFSKYQPVYAASIITSTHMSKVKQADLYWCDPIQQRSGWGHSR